MGLNRMMMKNGGVKVEDGSKEWSWEEVNGKTKEFTVPRGVKRLKVVAYVDYAEDEPDANYSATIKNTTSRKIWGKGFSNSNQYGDNIDHQDIDSIVGVTPNKTYTLHFDCYSTNGVAFSWGKAINDMTPTVEDY